jgi:hypothetical protein
MRPRNALIAAVVILALYGVGWLAFVSAYRSGGTTLGVTVHIWSGDSGDLLWRIGKIIYAPFMGGTVIDR